MFPYRLGHKPNAGNTIDLLQFCFTARIAFPLFKTNLRPVQKMAMAATDQRNGGVTRAGRQCGHITRPHRETTS